MFIDLHGKFPSIERKLLKNFNLAARSITYVLGF